MIDLQDLQNQTIIFDNYSTTLYEGTSIIPSDREHASLLLQTSWTSFKKGQHCTDVLIGPALIGFHKHAGMNAHAFRHFYGYHITENRKRWD
jgi:hypothetical protein